MTPPLDHDYVSAGESPLARGDIAHPDRCVECGGRYRDHRNYRPERDISRGGRRGVDTSGRAAHAGPWLSGSALVGDLPGKAWSVRLVPGQPHPQPDADTRGPT